MQSHAVNASMCFEPVDHSFIRFEHQSKDFNMQWNSKFITLICLLSMDAVQLDKSTALTHLLTMK